MPSMTWIAYKAQYNKGRKERIFLSFEIFRTQHSMFEDVQDVDYLIYKIKLITSSLLEEHKSLLWLLSADLY